MIEDKTHERRLLQEIKGLDQNDVEKILRMVHFMKKEILMVKKKRGNPNIMKYAGMLNDLTAEEISLFKKANQ